MNPIKANAQRFPYTTTASAIPTMVIINVDDGAISYQCPDSCWTEHHKAWCKAYRDKVVHAPVPQSVSHCMFENPIGYGCIVLGDTSAESRRKAMESSVRSMLGGGGWLKDVPPERAEAIIQATVNAKLKGVNTGASPFVACVAEWAAA